MENIEKVEKVDIAKMKVDIKAMVKEQRFYKNQRRTEKLVGERKISPSEATWKHQLNREKLRVMYAAYGFARGKSYSQIENKYPEESHPLLQLEDKILKILEGYTVMVEVENQD